LSNYDIITKFTSIISNGKIIKDKIIKDKKEKRVYMKNKSRKIRGFILVFLPQKGARRVWK